MAARKRKNQGRLYQGTARVALPKVVYVDFYEREKKKMKMNWIQKLMTKFVLGIEGPLNGKKLAIGLLTLVINHYLPEADSAQVSQLVMQIVSASTLIVGAWYTAWGAAHKVWKMFKSLGKKK